MKKEKRNVVREMIDKMLGVYNRHSVFTIAISYKELWPPMVCLVYPREHSMPGNFNPCAFSYGVLYRRAWKTNPEAVLDYIEKHWL